MTDHDPRTAASEPAPRGVDPSHDCARGADSGAVKRRRQAEQREAERLERMRRDVEVVQNLNADAAVDDETIDGAMRPER